MVQGNKPNRYIVAGIFLYILYNGYIERELRGKGGPLGLNHGK